MPRTRIEIIPHLDYAELTQRYRRCRDIKERTRTVSVVDEQSKHCQRRSRIFLVVFNITKCNNTIFGNFVLHLIMPAYLFRFWIIELFSRLNSFYPVTDAAPTDLFEF
ncbi:hypothetical protein [Nostoc sp.]|uniref:hypothetical protein n=1 Tax=Nostoc sp. TaxID=1180 RepID=UPI002FFA1807